jgi:hypothetical protein
MLANVEIRDEYGDAYPFFCPLCRREYSLLSSLFQHVSTDSCNETLRSHAMKKLQRWLQVGQVMIPLMQQANKVAESILSSLLGHFFCCDGVVIKRTQRAKGVPQARSHGDGGVHGLYCRGGFHERGESEGDAVNDRLLGVEEGPAEVEDDQALSKTVQVRDSHLSGRFSDLGEISRFEVQGNVEVVRHGNETTFVGCTPLWLKLIRLGHYREVVVLTCGRTGTHGIK